MNSFTFSSGTGADLTSKIALMNARRRQQQKAKEEEVESKVEDSVIAQASEAEEPDYSSVVSVDLAATPRKDDYSIELLTKKVSDLESEIKKMNKHVNAIAKFIKKGK